MLGRLLEEDVEVRPSSAVRPAGAVTVLAVEDEAALRALVGRMLQRQGHTTLLAAKAEEALLLLDQNPAIDVLLTDVVMPGTSGPELTRELALPEPKELGEEV